MSAERYSRHSLIDWFSQEKVADSSFAVIGCGAVGNEVAKNLALLGAGAIDLFDFDTIEVHNLTRSVLFREEDVGRKKAYVARERLIELDGNIKVEAFFGDFWELLTLEQAKKYDCIVCCVDNFEARIKLNQMCLITKTNFINTGIDSRFAQVEVFPFGGGLKTACYECNLPISVYERVQERYSCGWLKKISHVERKVPTTILASSLAGSLATSNALEFIKEPLTYSRRILADTFTGKTTVSENRKNHSCPACASLGKDIWVTKGTAKISDDFFIKSVLPSTFTTSDPVLVSHRCTKCCPNEKDATVVFQKASEFDTSIMLCEDCGEDNIAVSIKDMFTTQEVKNLYAGKRIPAKFIMFENFDSTLVIELE